VKGVRINRTKKITEIAKRMLIRKANIKLGFHCTSFNFHTFRFMGAHPASYSMVTEDYIPEGNAVGA